MEIISRISSFQVKPNFRISYIKEPFQGIFINSMWGWRKGLRPTLARGSWRKGLRPTLARGVWRKGLRPTLASSRASGEMPASKEIRPTLTSTPQILGFPTLATLAGIGNQPFMMVSQGVGQQVWPSRSPPDARELARVGRGSRQQGNPPDALNAQAGLLNQDLRSSSYWWKQLQ